MEDTRFLPKISGYLEKKGKKNFISCYKKYWFVLEGRLLLYYRSKDEYEAISPCKGSINLGPPCTVKPCSSTVGIFQIETRSTTITLRAESREEQNKWMQAVMSALNQNSNPTKLCHFRYSLGELPKPDSNDLDLVKKNTLPRRPMTDITDSNKILDTLQKHGAYAYIDIAQVHSRKSRSEESLAIQHSKSNEHIRTSIIEENIDYIGLAPEKRYNVDSVGTSAEGLYEKIPSMDSVVAKEDTVNVRKDDRRESEKLYIRENSIYSSPNTDRSSINSLYNMDKNVDVNDNSVNVENLDYVPLDNIDNYPPNSSAITNNGNQYDYIENALYSTADYAKSSSSSDTSNNAAKKPCTSRFRNFTRRLTSMGDQKTIDQKKLSKNSVEKQTISRKKSFIKRFCRNKQKIKRKNSIDENDYEVPPNINNNKIETINDENAVQILSEMKHILEKKLPQLQQQITYPENIEQKLEKKNSTSEEETIFGPDDVCPLLPPKHQRSNIRSPYHDVPKSNKPIIQLPPKKKNLDKITIDDILNDLDTEKPTIDSQRKLKPTNMPTEKDKPTEQSTAEDETTQESRNVKSLIKLFTDEQVKLRSKPKHQEIFNENKEQTRSSEQDELDRLLDELAKVTSAPLMTPGATCSLVTSNISDKEWLKILPVRCRRSSEPDYDIPRSHRSLPNLPRKEDRSLTATRFFGPVLNPVDIKDIRQKENSFCAHPQLEDTPAPPSLKSITPDSLEPDIQLSHSSSKTNTDNSQSEQDRDISYHSRDRDIISYHSRDIHMQHSYNSHEYQEILQCHDMEKQNKLQNFPRNAHVCQKKTEICEDNVENCLYGYSKILTVNDRNRHKMRLCSEIKTEKNSDEDIYEDSLEVYAEIGTTAF